MTHKYSFTPLTVALALVFGISPAAAQLTTGRLSGSVWDPHAAVVPGSTVTLISETRGTRLPNAISGTSGDFVLPNVPPDTYTLEISHQGFKTLRRTGIPVSAGDNVAHGPLTIEVGAQAETLTVTAAPPLLPTQNADRSF